MLFDLGRVIVDLDMGECESMLASRSGLNRAEFLGVLWDSGWIRRYERGEISTREFHHFLKTSGALMMDFEEFRGVWSEVFDPVPILSSTFLSQLGRRYSMTLVSNTNEAHADHIRRHYDVFDCFAHHILSYEVGALKPESKIFEDAIQATGHPPEAVLFIDDREENVAAGRAIGMQVHRFSSAAGLCRAFQDMGVDFQWPAENLDQESNGGQ